MDVFVEGGRFEVKLVVAQNKSRNVCVCASVCVCFCALLEVAGSAPGKHIANYHFTVPLHPLPLSPRVSQYRACEGDVITPKLVSRLFNRVKKPKH